MTSESKDRSKPNNVIVAGIAILILTVVFVFIWFFFGDKLGLDRLFKPSSTKTTIKPGADVTTTTTFYAGEGGTTKAPENRTLIYILIAVTAIVLVLGVVSFVVYKRSNNEGSTITTTDGFNVTNEAWEHRKTQKNILSKDKEWADGQTVGVAAQILKRPFVVFDEITKKTMYDTRTEGKKSETNEKDPVYLTLTLTPNDSFNHYQVANDKGEVIQEIEGDGNCFFRALSHVLYKNQNKYKKVKRDLLNDLKKTAFWKDPFPVVTEEEKL